MVQSSITAVKLREEDRRRVSAWQGKGPRASKLFPRRSRAHAEPPPLGESSGDGASLFGVMLVTLCISRCIILSNGFALDHLTRLRLWS